MPGPDYLQFKSYMENQRLDIYHHGILGQKWGERNGPPYPLNSSQKSSVEKKRESDNRRYSGEYKIKRYKSPTGELVKSNMIAHIKGLIGGTLLGPFFAIGSIAISSATLYKHYGDKKDYSKKEGQYEKISQLKKKDIKTTSEQDVKLTNPRIGQQKGKINNCVCCTIAMEMRNRGYDVQARSSGQGFLASDYKKWFNNVNVRKVDIQKQPRESRKNYMNRAYNEFCNKLEKLGNGASGCALFSYDKLIGGGHSIWFKVENNRVTFYDGQSGKINPDDLFALADPTKFEYARLDKLKLKEEVTSMVVSKKKGK